MSQNDPRGHGFNRVNNQWSTPRPRILSPVDYGWQRSHINQTTSQQVYAIGEIKLMAHPTQDGWLVQVNGSGHADHWVGHIEAITEAVLTDYDEPRRDQCGAVLSVECLESGRCLDHQENGDAPEPITESDSYAIEPAF